VQQRRPREAVADVRKSVDLSPHDSRQLYNAARVLCQAAICLEADPASFPGAWNDAGRYRAECIEFLARAVRLYPEADRAKFWDEVVCTDVAIEPVRKARKFLELDARVERPARANLPEKVSTHELIGPGNAPISWR